MAQRKFVPDRGDIVWLQFDPQAGREQGGKRPALVLSSRKYNAAARLAIVCPITSHAKGYPFEVQLPNDIKTSGVVLADHVKSADWQTRQAKFIERVNQRTLDDVSAKLAALLVIG